VGTRGTFPGGKAARSWGWSLTTHLWSNLPWVVPLFNAVSLTFNLFLAVL
jgi:hypothetical protein